MFTLKGGHKMKCLIKMFIILLVSFSSAVFAANGVSNPSGEERIEFPNGVQIYLRPTGSKWEVGYVKDHKRIALFGNDRILTVSQFAQSAVKTQKAWTNLPIMKDGQLVVASTFFFVMSETGLQFMRYLPGVPETPWFGFNVPEVKTVSMNRFSSSIAKYGDDILIPFSFSDQKGNHGTYVIRVTTTSEGKYSHYQVIALNKEFYELENGNLKKFKVVGDEAQLDGKTFNLKTLFKNARQETHRGQIVEDFTQAKSSTSIIRAGATSVLEVVRDVSQRGLEKISGDNSSTQPPISFNHDNGFKTPGSAAVPAQESTATSKELEEFEAFEKATREQALAHQGVNHDANGKSGERVELSYEGYKFVVYNLETKSGDGKIISGVYVQRESDKVTVQIAARMVNLSKQGDIEGFSIDEGILKHPDLERRIDLEVNGKHDSFKMESTFIPRKNSSEIAWLDGTFESFRSQIDSRVTVIEGRKALVADISEQILKPNRASSVLIGDSGDVRLIQQAVVENLPRTWRVLDLDPSVLGADIGIIGQKEERVKKIVEAIKSVPVIWMNQDFENIKGLGATEGKGDMLDMLNKEMGNNGYFKVIGTSYSSADFLNAINTPSIQNNLKLRDIPELTEEQVVEYLEKFLKANLDLPQVTKSFLRSVIDVADDLKPVGTEPERSIDVLEFHLRRLVKEGKPHLAQDRAELNKSATTLFNLPEWIRNRELMKLRLQSYTEKMNGRIIGHDHIKNANEESTKIAFSGLASDRGPGMSILLEGPPGTGKTEIAKAHAAALGLPLVEISMNQFKEGSGNGINELMSIVNKGLAINPFTVFLFDEIEKASYEVLEGMFTMMSTKKFNYYEKFGDKQTRARQGSAVRATFIGTANTIGDQVRDWFLKLPQDKRENMKASEMEAEFFKAHPKRMIEDYITQRIPRPLYDRFLVKMITFPPGEEALKGLMLMKIKEIEARVVKKYRVKMEFVNMKEFAQETIKRAFDEDWSTRDFIGFVERKAMLIAAEVQDVQGFKPGMKFILDFKTGLISEGQKVSVMKKSDIVAKPFPTGQSCQEKLGGRP